MNTLSAVIIGIFIVAMQLSVVVHILLYKEDVRSSIGWIGLVVLAPLLGSVIYVIFGINRIRRKALALSNKGPTVLSLSGKTADEIRQEVPPPLWQMLCLGYEVHPQHFMAGNEVTPLVNGDEAYPEMCRAIARAKKQVLIQSYIFDNDEAGKMFEQPIRQAVKNGASVRILVDGVGINYSRPNIKKLLGKIKGVRFSVFLPSKSPIALPFVNLRNHRKMLIVDGDTAFFGGMNIAIGNLIKSNPKSPIADLTFKVNGPVIDQMERIFEEDWTFSGKRRFHLDHPSSVSAQKDHSHITHRGIPARIIPDGPDSDYGKILLMLKGALHCAQKKISIVTPYFLPDNDMLDALVLTSLRGVEVELILPQKSNIFGMDWAMEANFEKLLKGHVKIYKTNPPFDHSKIVVMDDVWVFVGSANWDLRSLRLNFEACMECFSMDLARQLNKIIQEKKKNARAVHPHTQKGWRAVLCTARNNAFRLLTPYY